MVLILMVRWIDWPGALFSVASVILILLAGLSGMVNILIILLIYVDMCVSQRWIINKYDGSRHYVKCGHCEACQQEKALQRTNRVRAEFNSDRTCIFATLSYADPYVPYIKKDELYEFKRRTDSGEDAVLNVYRDCERVRSNSGSGYVVKMLNEPIRQVRLIDYSFHGKDYRVDVDDVQDFENLHFVRKGRDYFHHGKIGVINYEDFRAFYKKVRSYLKRRNYDKHYELFYVCEYGGDYARPHIHVLFSISPGDYELFKAAIMSSWSYSDHDRLDREVEIAVDPASYLASYVNCAEALPELLSVSPPFRPRHKGSHGFGMSLRDFSYESVCKAIDDGHMRYDVQVIENGAFTTRSIPLPKYVICRYFPKFKGFSRLVADEISHVLQRPSAIIQYYTKAGLEPGDCDKIMNQIRNTRKRLKLWTDGQWLDYIRYYTLSYNLHYAELMKYAYSQVQRPIEWLYFYYNISDWFALCQKPEEGKYYLPLVLNGIDRFIDSAPTLKRIVMDNYFSFFGDIEFDPNNWFSNRVQHARMLNVWNMYKKNKQITSQIYKSVKYG